MTTKKWNATEIEYLQDNWGYINIKTIAKRLKRTVNAIKLKAQKLNMNEFFENNSEFILLNRFCKIIYVRNCDGYDLMRFNKIGLPYTTFKKINRIYRIIYLENFLEWFKENLHKIDISNSENGDFGAIEPEWLIEKRKADKRAIIYSKRRDWTADEDAKLVRMLNKFQYSYREISIALKRTEGAIKRRMTDKGIKARPIKEEKRNWHQSEIETVKNLYKKGYKSCIIAEYVNRSALSINGLLERYSYFKYAR